ncbi:MAG: hypothetical protein IT424_06295 [Pirellulales bacterium]|nr:hypothetical protein [Pirellulales bacterium]
MFRSIQRALGVGVLGLALSFAAARLASGQIVIPPAGATVTWTDDALNGDWQDADNWNVHVPESGDAVIIDDGHHNVVLHADSATLRSLYVAGGIGLYNFGHRLPVANNSNTATTTITGNGSTIIVSDIPGVSPALDTDYLELQSGGELHMDGGRAQVDREVNMSGAAEISGHGVLEVGGAGAAALGFSSSSELTVEGGNLRFDMTGGGTIALGGAYIDVTDDDSDLILDGAQFGPIADTLRIGSGNTADFEGAWEVSGDLQFVTGGGHLVGGSGTVSGDVSVAGGADALIAGNTSFASTSTTTVNSLAELELSGRTTSAAGHNATLSYGSTLRLNLPPSPAPMPLPFVVWNGEVTAWSANIEANQPLAPSQPGFVQFAGNLTLTGSALWGPTDLQGSAPIILSGNTSVAGPGARINGAGIQFSPSSETTIANGSLLEVQSVASVNAGASISGAGELRVAQGGLLMGVDGAVVDADAVNHGAVRPGSGSDYSAHFNFAESYEQTATGVLEIDLAGALSSQYDRLVVEHDAAIDGALQVTLRDGFEPSPGDDFLILSAGDGVAGTFGDASLPALAGGLGWDVDYAPFSVSLSVVELTGDANGDGSVDGADLLIIQRDFGAVGEAAGDVTYDRVVNDDDTALWQQHFGTLVSATASEIAATQAVPEPGAAALATCLAMVLLSGAPRRRAR